jgi:hypothetical protein
MGWMVRIVSAALASTLALGASAQTLRGERLVAPRLDGWTIGYYRSNEQQSIREEVPRGQTVENWQRMVTTQRFTGLAARTSPAAYARDILGNVPASCPGARISPIKNAPVSGRPAVRFRVDCPSNPEAQGKPETFILMAVAGTADMHVKQVAFRGGLGLADLPWAERFLSGVAFCMPNDRSPACTR